MRVSISGTQTGEVSFETCRRAARAARTAEHGRDAIDTIRPRGISWLFRSRPPLSVLLYLSGLEHRLVWRSPEAFAVLEPPTHTRTKLAERSRRAVYLGFLDRNWDQLIFAVPPLLALLVAAALALIGLARPVWSLLVVALLLSIVALAYVAVLLTTMVARMSVWLFRRLEGRARLDELTGEAPLDRHWSMSLCHAADAAEGEELVRDALRLAGAPGEGGVEAAEIILYVERCVTTSATRDRLGTAVLVTQLSEDAPGLYAVHPETGVRLPDADAPIPTRGITLIAASPFVYIAAMAWVVADAERACAASSCEARPTSYVEAFVWLLGRSLIFVEPGGLSASSAMSQLAGWGTSVAGIVAASCVAVAVRRYMAERRRLVVAAAERIRRSLPTSAKPVAELSAASPHASRDQDAAVSAVVRLEAGPVEPALAPFEFRLMGELSLLVEGRQVGFGQPQQQLVLVFLLLADGWVSASRLIDDLWAGERVMPRVVHTHVSKVKRELAAVGLGSLIRSQRIIGYRVDVAPGQVDLLEFRRLARATQRAQALRNAPEALDLASQAVAMWREPVLGELPNGWADQVRAETRGQWRALVKSRLRLAIKADRAADVAPELPSIIAGDESDQNLVGLAMLTYAAAGMPEYAVGCRLQSARRSGGDADPKLTRLLDQIQGQDAHEIVEAARRGLFSSLDGGGQRSGGKLD